MPKTVGELKNAIEKVKELSNHERMQQACPAHRNTHVLGTAMERANFRRMTSVE
eukprot:SAG11_NODE_116_length_16002_cov_19.164560_21_plen_54_part_00